MHNIDQKYMKIAIELAKKGEGFVNPNPMVGAVIVKENRIIGQGYHKKFGEFHAERNAILNCSENMTGADMYVTLEPCCHYGKTPPCTDIIIKSGIKRVIVGCTDINPTVKNKGLKTLYNNGIKVEVGILEQECKKLNEIFFHYINNNTPFIIMKYAMTADGKIATKTGHSKWITGTQARNNVHKTRNKCMAVMVGIGTILADNPMLNCRIENGKNPIRIICDSNLTIPLDCNIINTAKDIKTYIATCQDNDNPKIKELQNKGANIINIHKKDNYLDLKELITVIGKYKIDSILLEGGAMLNYSALKSDIVNKIQCYIAPKIFGGNAKTPVTGLGVDFAYDSFKFKTGDIKRFDEDILIEFERR